MHEEVLEMWPILQRVWIDLAEAEASGTVLPKSWTEINRVEAAMKKALSAPTAPIGEAGVREAANAIFDVIWPLQEWDDEETVCRAASEQAARAALAALGEQGEG